MIGNPCLYSGSVLRRYQPHGDERMNLREAAKDLTMTMNRDCPDCKKHPVKTDLVVCAECDEEMFRSWLQHLELNVIQGEFGYERGEFAVYPEHWRSAYEQDLSPRKAFEKFLEAAKRARDERDRQKAEN